MIRICAAHPAHHVNPSRVLCHTRCRGIATKSLTGQHHIEAIINGPPSTQSEKPERFDATNLNVYSTSIAPRSEQLQYASRFFTTQSPPLLFSKAQFRLLPQSHHPEVTFLGRSNVGKSSMLNALFSRKEIALTSSKPGKTRLMNAFGVSPYPLSAAPQSGTKGEIMDSSWRRMRGGCLVVDMPGYGANSRADWGTEIMKYIEQRRQLRRAFLLVDSEHGLKNTDLTILAHLFSKGIPHTIVLSKIDKLVHPGPRTPAPPRLEEGIAKVRSLIESMRERLRNEVWAGREMGSDFLCVSSEKSLDQFGIDRAKIGIDELRWAILCACGLQETSARSSSSLGHIEILD